MIPVKNLTIFPYLLADDVRGIDKLPRVIFGRTPFFQNYTSSLKNFGIEDLEEVDWAERVKMSRGDIYQHLERRVSQFFMMAAMCYDTGYSFGEGRVMHQGYSSKQPKDSDLKMASAHSATLPCLFAYSEESEVEVVYLYRAGFYDESNATVDMVVEVNRADLAIDDKYKNCSLLRENTVSFLNKAAKGGKNTPERMTRLFVAALIKQIEESIEREKNAKVRDVLRLYGKKAERLKEYVADPDHTDRWLNVEMSNTHPDWEEIRGKIHKLRARVIQADQQAQSVIKCKMDEVYSSVMKAAVKARREKEDKKEVKGELAPFFYQALFDMADNSKLDKMRIKLCKLLNISSFTVNQSVCELKIGAKYHKSLEIAAIKISQLSGEIHDDEEEFDEERGIYLADKVETLCQKIQPKTKVGRSTMSSLVHKRLYDFTETSEQEDVVASVIGEEKDEVEKIIARKVNNSKENTIEKVISAAEKEFKKIIKIAEREVEKLQEETKEYRKQLLIHLLGHYSKGSVQKFMKTYRKSYPDSVLNENLMVEFVEGERALTSTYIGRFAKIFGVDKSLFYPSHFAEEK